MSRERCTCAVFAVAMASLAAGCGSPTSGPSAQPTTSSPSEGGASTGDAGSRPKRGVILVLERTVVIAFMDPDPAADAGVTTMPIPVNGPGSCTVDPTVDQRGDVGGDLLSAATDRPGELTITSTGGTVVDPGTTNGPPYAIETLLAEPAGGSQVRVQASGSSTVPRLDISLVVPDTVAYVAPAGLPTAHLTIQRASGLPMVWSGGTVGDVAVGISQSPGGIERFLVNCSFPEAVGGGVIPPEALAFLSAAPSGDVVSLEEMSSQTTMVGDWTIQAFVERNTALVTDVEVQ